MKLRKNNTLKFIFQVLSFLIVILGLILSIILSSCSIHNYRRGDVLLPSDLNSDTLIVVIPFTLPDLIDSEEDIDEYINKRTIKFN